MAQVGADIKQDFDKAPGAQVRPICELCLNKMAAGKIPFSNTCNHRVRWYNEIPFQRFKTPLYSTKVFLGGFSAGTSAAEVRQAFGNLGVIEAPEYAVKKNGNLLFCYLIMTSSDDVRKLLSQCRMESSSPEKEHYYKLPASFPWKEVEVIPWEVQQSRYCFVTPDELKSNKRNKNMTVFVGGLHGLITAYSLARIMNELFGSVAYVDIDTDKTKYPIGSARVTFRSYDSFMRAVKAEFMQVKTTRFHKQVQIDPYIEEQPCSMCQEDFGPCFCRYLGCLKYYCHRCWANHKSTENTRHEGHKKVEKPRKTKVSELRKDPEIRELECWNSRFRNRLGQVPL
ncbi:cytoplasmic polyadenylation element-binding protein 1-like [Watersipora subatra]|uniref:cytoplasmic polyadenylation element-binding protein 1-like n=1 Tax=Watersipora subatra TaxID=2589382 RepID=UPI00355AD61A